LSNLQTILSPFFFVMRVLNTTTFELHSREQEFFKSQGYAILSHRWVGAEITFETLPQHISTLKSTQSRHLDSPQLSKIRGACEMARQLGFAWVWIDNCCINKASSTEESESINSMYTWYRDAQICITYLSDVKLDAAPEQSNQNPPKIFQKINSDQPSEWFFRGWTLQELLAPRKMNFYDTNWTYMGTKDSLAQEIENITGISPAYLTNAVPFRDACIATKMSWMAGRKTTREEDIAYGMLGIFSVFLAPRYGEGMTAFMRLQQNLQTRTSDESLYAWRMPQPSDVKSFGIERNPGMTWGPGEWGLLAPTPHWFRGCGNVTIDGGPWINRTVDSFRPTPEGLRMEVFLSPSERKRMYTAMALGYTLICSFPAVFYVRSMAYVKDNAVFPLNCWERTADGRMAAVAIRLGVLPSASRSGQNFKRVRCEERLLTHKYTSSSRYPGRPGVLLQPKIRYDD
jgi:hypothetical protein